MGSPVRRVLGDKTTNASVKPRSPTKTWKNPTASHDNLSISFGERTHSHSTSLLSRSPRLGQKRRIEEVDQQEPHATQNSNDTHRLSQSTDFLSDGSSHADDMLMDSMDNAKSTAQSSLISFRASQAEAEPVEVQFEIHEEMSQQTLDNMHEVFLPQNISQPSVLLRPNLLKETSQVSVSLSSLIDFDQDKSSQASDGIQILEHAEKTGVVPETTKAPKSEGEIRKGMLSEKAETLRTRLQLALYKVQTNQTSKPFSRLNRPRPRSPELPPPPMSSSPLSSPHRRTRFISTSPESRIAIARARASLQVKPSVKPLSRLEHPTIVPTTFSARYIVKQADTEEAQIPSSPPLSNNNELSVPIRVGTPSLLAKTKAAESRALPITPMQLSSPPGSPDIKISTVAKKLKDSKYGGLTSSVVKGEAANGLLELMRGGSGSRDEGEAGVGGEATDAIL